MMHETFWSIVLSPAHTFAEIFWTIVLDVIIVGIIWPKVRKRIKHEHRVIDLEHGYVHDAQVIDGHVCVTGLDPNDPIPYGLTIKGWTEQS